MSTAALVVVCALNLLGRSAAQFPRIELLDVRPPGVSANAEAFARRNPDVIYLITASPVFRGAQWAEATQGRCRDRDGLKKIASILVHEEWHLRHGPDERGAYAAQLTALALLGAGPESRLHHSVKRSMQSVVDAPPQRRPEQTRLSRR
jgi:hypothetical protein